MLTVHPGGGDTFGIEIRRVATETRQTPKDLILTHSG